MKEVEVKAKLRNKRVVMDKLQSLGCVFEEPITQDDRVYGIKTGSVADYISNRVFVRLRIKDGAGGLKKIFTVKRPLDTFLNKLEHETEVADENQMEKAILEMGYRHAVRINKTRVTTHYNGWEICIDNIDNLGVYIEVESMIEDESEDSQNPDQQIQDKLFAFLVSLGISPADREIEGYDILMLRKLEAEK